MAKELSGTYEEIWFDVDIFKIDENEDVEEQINKAINEPEHCCFIRHSMMDAVLLANNLLSDDKDYNLALITLNRYSNWNTEDEKCEDSVIVGEIWAD